jgi:hypothetical protein
MPAKKERRVDELERAFELVRDNQPDPAEGEDSEEFIRFKIQVNLVTMGARIEQAKQWSRIANAFECLAAHFIRLGELE